VFVDAATGRLIRLSFARSESAFDSSSALPLDPSESRLTADPTTRRDEHLDSMPPTAAATAAGTGRGKTYGPFVVDALTRSRIVNSATTGSHDRRVRL
jgi:hypothetical protein